jgi:hypothetical protein
MVGRDAGGHFLGFRARLTCENMPVIPAWLVRRNLNVCLDKTQSAFKTSDIRGGPCNMRYIDEHPALASFRRTRDWPNNSP